MKQYIGIGLVCVGCAIMGILAFAQPTPVVVPREGPVSVFPRVQNGSTLLVGTNAGQAGQILFNDGNGFAYWDFGTNAPPGGSGFIANNSGIGTNTLFWGTIIFTNLSGQALIWDGNLTDLNGTNTSSFSNILAGGWIATYGTFYGDGSGITNLGAPTVIITNVAYINNITNNTFVNTNVAYIQNITNNTFVNTNVAFIQNITNNTFVNTNVAFIQNITNNTFVNTNVAFIQNITNNTFVNTNVSITQLQTNNTFVNTNVMISTTTNYNNYSITTNLYSTNITANKITVNNFIALTNAMDNLTVTNGITNNSLSASQFVATDTGRQLVSTLNGSTLTNLTIRYDTNAMPNTGVLTFGHAYWTNMQVNLTLPALTLGSAAYYESLVFVVTNSGASDLTVTVPSGVRVAKANGGGSAIYCTNKTVTVIYIEHYGNIHTNAWKNDF